MSAIKRNVTQTISHQLNAVHDIGALANVIEGILRENQEIKEHHSNSFRMLQNISNITKKMSDVEDDIQDLKKVIRSQHTDVSYELSSIRDKCNFTSQHQLSAVHDVAYLADIVEGLNNEVQGLRSSLEVTGNGNRSREVRPISVIQTGNRSLEMLTSFHNKIDQLERDLKVMSSEARRINAKLSDDLVNMKNGLNSTSNRFEVASLSEVVSRLGSDLEIVKNSMSQNDKQFSQQNQKFDSILSHQNTAVHDIALLSRTVEKLANEGKSHDRSKPGLPTDNRPPPTPEISYGAQTVKNTKPQNIENQMSKFDKIFERLTHLESYLIPETKARLSNVEAGLSRFENQLRSTGNGSIQVKDNLLVCSHLPF